MMPIRHPFGLLLAAGVFATAGSGQAFAQDRLSVVASFSILADFANEIGGDRVAVHTIIPPGADAHSFEPTPADARALAEADLVIINGLGFEGGLVRLIDASGYGGAVVVATDGIDIRDADDDHDHEDADHEDADHDHGAFDPHGWQDVENARIYARNIAAGLTAANPGGAEIYAANLAELDAELAALDVEIEDAIAALPDDRRTVVTSHDAFGYFSDAYGIAFLAPVGVAAEADPAAGDIAALTEQIRAEGIDAILLESVTDPRILEQIARETGATIGGTVYADTLTEPDGPAPTYVQMMRHNLAVLVEALDD